MAMLSQAILRAMALNAPRVQPSVTESGVYPMCSGLRFDLARMARRFPGRHLLFGRSRLMSVPMPLSRCVRKTEAHHYRAAQSGLRRLTRGRQLADLPRTPAASYRGGCNAGQDPHEESAPETIRHSVWPEPTPPVARSRHADHPLPRLPGVTRVRRLLLGTNTPWKPARLSQRLETKAASLALARCAARRVGYEPWRITSHRICASASVGVSISGSAFSVFLVLMSV
jgi:hypothetical protein